MRPSAIQGLDGLRAVAVVTVLLYHAGFAWMGGGFLGVEIFFVISGFLITHLLLNELADTGKIDLRIFWIRRLRRLLPALLALLLGVGAAGAWFLGARASQFRADILASLLYAENWYQIHSGSSYFADRGYPLLRHLWSLAVEGQFYLVWPLAVLGGLALFRRRPRLLAVLFGLLALGSSLLMLLLVDLDNPSSVKALESINRVYLGTDTRASGLLLGGLLAVLLRPGALDPARKRLGLALDLGAILALGALLFLCGWTDSQAPFLYWGGFLVVDLLTALVLAALLHPAARLLRPVLGWEPLEALGRRSYGLYLWHWPVFKVVGPGEEGYPWFALRLGITAVLVEGSYRFVETPIRRGALKRWMDHHGQTWGMWRRKLVLGTAGLLLALSGAEAVALSRRAPFVDEIQESIQANAAVVDQPGAAPHPHPQLSGALRPPVPAPEPLQLSPLNLSPLPPLPEGLNVTAIGDSVMKGAALQLKEAGEATLGEGHLVINAEESRSFFRAEAIVREYRETQRLGDVVVIHLGTNNSAIDPRHFGRLMDGLADRRLVIFLTAKSDKLKAVESVNQALMGQAGRYPNVRILDWKKLSEEHPDFFFSDQTHLRPRGSRFYAHAILSQIAAAHTDGSLPPRQERVE